MAVKRSLIGGAALIAVGAVGAYSINHVQIHWGPTAQAAPVVVAEAKPALPPPSKEQVSDARMLSRTFAQVASQLSPSVVRISVAKTVKMQRGMHFQGGASPGGGNPFEGTPFERFFGQGGPEGDDGDQPTQGPKQRGTGSGVVIDAKGYILTNNHVVEDADEVKVTWADGKTVNAKVVGTDPRTDLAVVKVDPSNEVRPAKIGDSDKLQVGEWVMAIGNPFGLDHTVTVGVLSAKNRSGFQSGSSHYEDFLQTDASINPGNSGGPLINLDGEVIGINSMIAGIGTGIGFAVPSSMFKSVADQLIHGGKVRRPYLGIFMQDVNEDIQKTLGNKAPEKGALVSQVEPGKPAEKAGLKPGDVITSVDGQPVDGSKSVQRSVLGKQIGQKIDLGIWRDGKTMKLSATAAELPGEKGETVAGNESSPKAKLGLGLQSLNSDLADQVGVSKGTKGAVVMSVREGSPAQEAGIRQKDVILEVDRKAVSSSEDAAKYLGENRAGGHLIRLQRGPSAIFLVIPQS
jgi:serine protease Do